MHHVGENPHLVLASASPRRRELLHEAGYDFEVHPAEVDEDDFPASLLPADLATMLARQKAEAIAQRFPERVVLGADTVVAFGDQILGKPRDAVDAVRMLTLLAGTTHIVITGVAVVFRMHAVERVERVMSAVQMKSLTDVEIRRYVDSRLWEGKAGGYGIQDPDPFVRRVAGDFTNIVGLPIKVAKALLHDAGVDPVRPAST